MKEIEVERLVHDARSQLKVLEFRQSTLAEYERLVFSPIQKFFRDHEERFFNTALSADFLTATKRDEELGIIPPKASRLRERGIQLMVELYLTGNFTCRRRIAALREFGKFLSATTSETYIIPAGFAGTAPRYTPYIFTDNELRCLFQAADQLTLSRRSPRRHLILPVLLRLIYFCGLRLTRGEN